MVQDDEPVGLDALRVEFDDERVVSDAGVMLVAALAGRLGIEALAGQLVRLRRDRPGAAHAARKGMALLFSVVLGADSIDDADVLRAGRTRRLLGGWLPAPSTLGTFLRAFTFGHVRQLDALLGRALERAWKAGAGPGDGRVVVDVDSFVGEVCGRLKQGAAYGYTRLLGYHPILATRADTREALHIRLRKGSANTQKGMLRFTNELIARVDRAGATGVKLLRADSGFQNTKVFERLEKGGLAVLDRRAHDQDRPSRRRSDRRGRLDEDRRLPRRRVRRRSPRPLTAAAADRRPHAAARRPGRTVARLATLRLSSPTAPTTSRWWRPSTATTPLSSRSSPTSKTKHWRTSPPGTSTPTQRGPCSPRWPTTCSDGRSCSDSLT